LISLEGFEMGFLTSEHVESAIMLLPLMFDGEPEFRQIDIQAQAA
jgi:hypothetical protein